MFKLAYISVATRKMSSQDLQDILQSAIENNRQADVSGVLLFNGTNFMQVLEGKQSEVEQVFSDIKNDDRHKNVVVIYRESSSKRDFEDSPMLLQIVPATYGKAPDGVEITKDIALFLPPSLAGHFRTILESFDTHRD